MQKGNIPYGYIGVVYIFVGKLQGMRKLGTRYARATEIRFCLFFTTKSEKKGQKV